MQSKKQRFAKKQTSAPVLPQFVDQSVQHIHHLALPFWGQGFQSLGELCGVKQRCRIQIILKQLVRSNLEYIGDGNQLIQFWCFDSALDHTHVVYAVFHGSSKVLLRHTGTLTGSFDSFSQCDLIHTAISF